MDRKHKVEGEGSYSGSKDYNERTKKFIESGKVEEAAHKAAPADRKQEEDMKRAEQVGRSRAKGEDPALKNPSIAERAEQEEKRRNR